MTDMRQPFMTAIFTASNHHPFRIPQEYEGKFPEGSMQIHKTVGYTDNALKEFFAVAKKQPWYENTIFVITNDHTNMRGFDEYRSDIGSFYGPVIISIHRERLLRERETPWPSRQTSSRRWSTILDTTNPTWHMASTC